jgi:hypothetical protein
MSPPTSPRKRRHWPSVTAGAVLALFTLFNFTLFRAAAGRYRLAIKNAEALGLSLDPSKAQPLVPPRAYALLSHNSLPAPALSQQASSGALASDLVTDITRLVVKHGMEVVLIEPGATSEQTNWAKTGAHLKLTCSYAQFVALLDDLARSGQIVTIERFNLSARESAPRELEMWVSRLVLKQSGKTV